PHIVVETNRVRVKSQKDAWISIYTTHGSMVQMLKSSSGNWMESMPLNDDFYVVRVQETGQKAYSRKVLIRTVGK
ncbi:T9SS type A sorting domain-containing protein, partial [Bacteroides intestinalis]